MQPESIPWQDAVRVIRQALEEDVGSGDITSALTVPPGATARMSMVTRAEITVCGLVFVEKLYSLLDPSVRCEIIAAEGAHAAAGEKLAIINGPARSVLAGERAALNLLQHLCGVATLTRRFVAEVAGTGAVIMDTRKTLPGLRALEKYAVRTGGGVNHRMGLYDGILIKDNHIAIAGNVEEAVRAAKAGAPAGMKIGIECDTLAQAEEALAAGADILLLDNMELGEIRKAVALANNRALVEVSGGVTLAAVRALAEAGADRVSVGALTHSAPAADIGLDM